MKKTWLWALEAALLIGTALLLSACGEKEPADQEAPAPAEQQTEETPAVGTEAQAGGLGAGTEEGESVPWQHELLSAGDLVFLREPTEQALAEYEGFDEYILDPDGERLLFYSRQEIPGFRIVSAKMNNDGGNIAFDVDTSLYSLDTLTPERPLLVQLLPAGDLFSGYGVLFSDPEDPDRQHFYLLSVTGRGEPGDPPLIFQEIY